MANENEPDEQRGGDGGSEPATDWKAEARKWERRSNVFCQLGVSRMVINF